MKIVFLQDDFPPQSFGGAGISTYELALGMKKAGHQVFVITTCRKEDEDGESEYKGLKIFKIASNYHGKWRAYLSLYNRFVARKADELMKKIKPDLALVNNIHFYLSYHCLKIAKRHAKVVIFTARDAMAFNYGKLETKRYLEHFNYRTTWLDHIKQAKKRWNPMRNLFIKRYLKYADKIVAISGALKDALEQNKIKNVRVIHNGIDASKWNVSEDEMMRFKEKYNIQNKKILLFGGRLSSSKGGAKTIEALSLIYKEDPNVALLVAGKIDEYTNAMKKYAEELGIVKQLIFTGWIERDEIKILYAVSDIALMPSICFDAFGRVNIEAMASRKPVIGTCYGGTPEVVIDGVTGYIVNPLYPEQIAKKVIKLLKDPEKAKQFGNAGYERIKKHFNLEDKVKEYLDVYDNIRKKENILIK